MPLSSKNKRIEEILSELCQEKIDLLDELYSLIKKDIYSFALSKMKNSFDIDDIIQETIVTIYKNAKLYTPRGKPLAWIITIENNLINKMYNDKNKFLELDENIFNDKLIIDDSKKYIDNGFLLKLLNHLNQDERQIISLHIVSDLKFKEIAQILNKPISTILSKYNRSIKKIQSIAKEEELWKELIWKTRLSLHL